MIICPVSIVLETRSRAVDRMKKTETMLCSAVRVGRCEYGNMECSVPSGLSFYEGHDQGKSEKHRCRGTRVRMVRQIAYIEDRIVLFKQAIEDYHSIDVTHPVHDAVQVPPSGHLCSLDSEFVCRSGTGLDVWHGVLRRGRSSESSLNQTAGKSILCSSEGCAGRRWRNRPIQSLPRTDRCRQGDKPQRQFSRLHSTVM